MRRINGIRKIGTALAAVVMGPALAVLVADSAAAGPYADDGSYHRHGGTRWERTDDHPRYTHKHRHMHRHRHVHKHRHVQKRVVVIERYRRHKHVWTAHPHGYRYREHAPYHVDNHDRHWFGVTVLFPGSIDRLSDAQWRRHESAQITATTAPIGETIHWKDKTASGSVRVVREGTSSSGRYCREFQQKIKIGGRIEDAYGTACQQPDGAWELLP